MLAARADELEQVLEERDELVLPLAVRQEQREEDREVARLYEDLLRQLLRYLAGHARVVAQVLQRTHTLE